MASTQLVAKLPQQLKQLVLATANGAEAYGKTPLEETQVTEWISKASRNSDIDSLAALNIELTPRTYLVAERFTAADAAVYGALHPVVSTLSPAQYFSHPAVTRYFDHIQHLSAIRSAPSAPSLVAFDLDKAPKLPRSAEPKKKEKAPKPAADAQAQAATTTKPAKAEEPKVANKPPPEAAAAKADKPAKEKKEKPAKAPTAAAPPADDGAPVPSMIDLRVGRIVHVERHPDADTLYVEQIDIGEPTGPRTVVSGLVKYVPIEEMRDRLLIAVCNLKPAAMRGVKSHAMVLCASSAGKESVELLVPPPGSQPGDRVFFEGEHAEKQPLEQLNPKKKIFETIQPGFTTLSDRQAAWVDAAGTVHRIRTERGYVLSPTLVGASLS